MNKIGRILMIIDDPEILEGLYSRVGGKWPTLACVPDVASAAKTAEKWVRQFDLVLIEDNRRSLQGLNLMLKAHALRRSLPIIMVSRDEDPDASVKSVASGAVFYCSYPFDADRLNSVIEDIFSEAALPSPS